MQYDNQGLIVELPTITEVACIIRHAAAWKITPGCTS